MRIRVSLLAVVMAVPLTFAACSSSDEGAPTDAGTSPGPADVQVTLPPTGDDAGIVTSDAGADAAVGSLSAGAACTADTQCASGGCDDTMHCASGKSCTQLHGGRTCGPNGDQSCCDAIAMTMPKGKVTLDKYNITAGRMRAFVEKTNGNVRGYVQDHLPAWFDAAWLPWLPIVLDDGTKTAAPDPDAKGDHTFHDNAGRDGVYQQLGPYHWKVEAPTNEGCLTKSTGNARAYWLPPAVNTTDFDDVQRYDKDTLDEKALQCVTYFMAAAFCIWDGGRMPTLDELDFAYDGGEPAKHKYPWGDTPVPGGWNDAFPMKPVGFGTPAPAGADLTYANNRYDWWSPSQILCKKISGTDTGCDYSVYIAPPGRFKGAGPFGHLDLVGGVYDMAQPATQPPVGTIGDNLKVTYTRNQGAFDGHGIVARDTTNARSWDATDKYVAVGARCAR